MKYVNFYKATYLATFRTLGLTNNVNYVIITGWRTKCHTIDCKYNTFLLLQKHLTSGTELTLIRWEIVPNESL